MRLLVAAAAGLLAFCIATPLGGPAFASQPQPVFKSGGTTVPVYATVVDRSHRLVTDLSSEDFTVMDEGAIRPLTFFERNVLPISVLVLLDTSVSMRQSIGTLRDAARHFVANLLPSDRVQFGAFNANIKFVRPFTNDKATLNRLLDLVGPEMIDFGTALWPAIDRGLKEFNAVEGRKVLLVFSDGENNVGKINPLSSARAVADNIMVYAVTLQTEYPLNGRDTCPGRGCVKSVLDPFLPKLVDDTGGGYFELTKSDDLAATFARVAEELHHQYTLGFEAAVLDGKTHQIAVQVRGEGLTPRARRSYLAARPK